MTVITGTEGVQKRHHRAKSTATNNVKSSKVKNDYGNDNINSCHVVDEEEKSIRRQARKNRRGRNLVNSSSSSRMCDIALMICLGLGLLILCLKIYPYFSHSNSQHHGMDSSNSDGFAAMENEIIPFPQMANRVLEEPNFIDRPLPDPWGRKSDGEKLRKEVSKVVDQLRADSVSKLKQPKFKHIDYTPIVGDKTPLYAAFREHYETKVLPPQDTERIKARVKELKGDLYRPIDTTSLTYDIYNCPEFPPPNYPYAWNAEEVLRHWPSDVTDPPDNKLIYQGICVFDFSKPGQEKIALNYRTAEVPFLVNNDINMMRTVERWNHPGYMNQLMGDVPHRCEYSHNNHFMYFNNPNNKRGKQNKRKKKNVPENWSPPTELIHIAFQEWLTKANTPTFWTTDAQHWYYRLIGCGGEGQCDANSSEYLFDELPIFQPTEDNFYMVEPKRQKGIHCRFGMKGVIAENHYDGSRNFVALFGGERRYMLSHPDQCLNEALYPQGHPSARHSAIDWSDPSTWDKYPQFADAEINEVVLQAGDILYLPTYWFHYIISLDTNFQCNSRSGIGHENFEYIKDCGFQ